jgi:hypothetical protein
LGCGLRQAQQLSRSCFWVVHWHEIESLSPTGVASPGISPRLMRWELTMMRLAAACQKTLVSRTTRIASALMMFASACPGTDRRQLIDVVADDKKRGFVGGSSRPSAIRYGLRPLPRRAKARSSPSSRCQPSSQWRQSGLEPMPQMSWSSSGVRLGDTDADYSTRSICGLTAGVQAKTPRQTFDWYWGLRHWTANRAWHG